MNKLLVSPSPHIHSKDSTRSLMMDVVIALLPAVICSFVFYGWREMVVMAVSVASCVLLEWAITKYMLKKPSTIGDMSAVITGMLLALNVPYTTPWWVIVIGSVVAIGVAKLTFGGIGQNIWNPALVGRVFLLVSFPTYMTTWGAPQGVVDAVSGPTPLGAISEGLMQGATVQEITSAYGYKDLLFANLGGSAGEVCALALHHLCHRGRHIPHLLGHQPGPLHGSRVQPAHRRSGPGRLLHGHGLCHQPHEREGRHRVRCGNRLSYHDDPLLRLLSGRRFLRHPYHELCGAAA